MKKTLLTGLACGMFVIGMTGAANAISIVNGDFELQLKPDGMYIRVEPTRMET